MEGNENDDDNNNNAWPLVVASLAFRSSTASFGLSGWLRVGDDSCLQPVEVGIMKTESERE